MEWKPVSWQTPELVTWALGQVTEPETLVREPGHWGRLQALCCWVSPEHGAVSHSLWRNFRTGARASVQVLEHGVQDDHLEKPASSSAQTEQEGTFRRTIIICRRTVYQQILINVQHNSEIRRQSFQQADYQAHPTSLQR